MKTAGRTGIIRVVAARSRGLAQRGMVTIEIAVGLLILALVVGFSSWCVGLVMLQDRCGVVATQIARQIARGDGTNEAKAKALLPKGASVSVQKNDGWVVVNVTSQRSWGRMGSVTLRGKATLPLEPGQS